MAKRKCRPRHGPVQLNERVSLSFDVYQNRTSKMIVYQPLNAASGLDYIATNSGGMKTTGWEATVTTRIIDHKKLKWDFGFNIAQSKSVITALPAGSFTTDYADGTMITKVGGAPNLFYGYKTAGIFTTDAEAASAGLVNRNRRCKAAPRHSKGATMSILLTPTAADNVIDANDRQVIGNPNPKFYGGVNSRLML